MKNKVSLKEKRVCKAYVLEQKMGMTALDGSIIIPKEYDRIISLNDDLFAAVMDNPESGIIIDCYAKKTTVGARSALSLSDLDRIWSKDVKKKISAVNIDFYSTTGKFKCNKRVLAYYYSKNNKVLVLLDENYTWNIACIDYENHEIIIDEKYVNISDIKGLYDARFLIRQNERYKVISLHDKVDFELMEGIFVVKDYPKGLLVRKKCEAYGFVDYSGKEILSCAYSKILPKEDYIKVENFDRQSIRSYDGKEVVPYFTEIFLCNVKKENIFEVKEKALGANAFLYGLYSTKYGCILEPEYSRIEVNKDGVIIYCRDGNWGLARYDEQSHKVIEIIDGHSWIRFSRSYNNQTMVVSKDFMKFNHNGHNQYIIVRKRFRYAIYDTDGTQIRKFRYRCFIPKKDLWMYDYFEW